MTTFNDKFEFSNGIELKNRIVMAPMTTWSGDDKGNLSKEELSYYHRRSKEVGMVITATTYTVEHGKGFKGQFYCGSDDYLESMTELARAIHKGGAVAILQVFHAGRKSNPSDMPDGVTRSASAVAPNRNDEVVPKAMTEDEIQVLIQSYYDVVVRAHKAGFDGIEIHGANTYLLQQFFSPDSNIRTDEWGGSLEKRVRLPLKVIDTCIRAREDIGNQEFIIGYRFSPEENYEVGITLEDNDYLVDQLCQTDLDYLHVSLGHYKATSMRDRNDKQLIMDRLVKTINHRKPFMSVGSVRNHKDANEVLDLGADLVAIGKQLIAEPEMVSRMISGDLTYKKYQEAKFKELEVPTPLHEMILNAGNWFEVE